jgi:class 3 adenylate cyclase
MAIHTDRKIYVGTYHNFGYLWPGKSNRLEFVSLTDSTDFANQHPGTIEKIISFNNLLFFTSKHKLFQWDGEKVHLLDSAEKIQIFRAGEHLFLKKKGEALQEYIHQQFQPFPVQPAGKEEEIHTILPYHQQLLAKTDKGFYIFDHYSVSLLSTGVNDLIDRNIFSAACVLPNGNYALGTKLNGIFVMDKTGKLIEHIDESGGLLSISINDLFVDQSQNLWALHDQGLSRIEYPSAYSYFSQNHGLQGNITGVVRFQNTLYVSTSLGVFYLSETSGPPYPEGYKLFQQIPGINSHSYHFHPIREHLFVSTAKGIYEIKDKKSLLFYNRESEDISSVLHSSRHPSWIFLGHSNGLSAIQYKEGLLVIKKHLEGITDKICSIAEEEDGTLWLASKHMGVYKIDPFEKYDPKLTYTHYPNEAISSRPLQWIHLYSTHQGVLFSTTQGVFRYNPDSNHFYQDTTLLPPEFTPNSQWVYPIAEDRQKNLWLNIMNKGNKKNKTLVRQFDNHSFQAFKPLPVNRLQDFFITSIHPDDSGMVWFGGYEGLIRLDLNQETMHPHEFNAYMHKVIPGQDSSVFLLPYHNFHQQQIIPKYNYPLNRIYFEFTANDYASEDLLVFQYKLEGFDSTWSNWSPVNFKEYTNLHEGKYTFSVRAKNILDEISEKTTYTFVLKPPIYRTTGAYIVYIILFTFLILLIFKWRSYYFARERFKLENIIQERTDEIIVQKEKADNLLERVLPKSTARELKSGQKAGPYHYNMVTVLFSDIQGFTRISEQLDSEHLIDQLDKFFLQFDTVVEKYNIEKIKTIGDAYMCAGGIPEKNRTNPIEVVLAAMEMQQYMKGLKLVTEDGHRQIWDLRIGIDTGPIIAGVLGRKKITYDIWGGTVNTASRMEASGEAGKINITENTYMLIKDFFICKYRGKMPVKYKGEIDMYFVEGFKPQFATDLKGLHPNDNLFIQLQLLRVNDVEEFVLSKLENGLPDNLYYHNVKHTIDVVTQVELIGRSEGVSEEDMLILKSAALFHDIGHLINYDTHEEEGVRMARKILPKYQYSPKQIEKICRLIMVTQMPPQPQDLLEEIMCDADLDYLGRTDFVPVSINLYKELHERNKIDSIMEWNKMQIDFIKKHQYFTQTAQKLREVNKKKQLENIQEEIKREMEQTDE